MEVVEFCGVVFSTVMHKIVTSGIPFIKSQFAIINFTVLVYAVAFILLCNLLF